MRQGRFATETSDSLAHVSVRRANKGAAGRLNERRASTTKKMLVATASKVGGRTSVRHRLYARAPRALRKIEFIGVLSLNIRPQTDDKSRSAGF